MRVRRAYRVSLYHSDSYVWRTCSRRFGQQDPHAHPRRGPPERFLVAGREVFAQFSYAPTRLFIADSSCLVKLQPMKWTTTLVRTDCRKQRRSVRARSAVDSKTDDRVCWLQRSHNLSKKGAEGNVRRTSLCAAMRAALLVTVSFALALGFGGTGSGVVQTRTPLDQ